MRGFRLAALAMLVAVASAPRPHAQGLPFSLFERYLESLREQTGIPGISAVIVQGGRPVWSAGLGRQDVERIDRGPRRHRLPDRRPDARPSPPCWSVQCVDRNGLSINQPIRQWTDTIPEGSATLRNVLSHASSGVPGEAFRYDPGRYAALTNVVDACDERPFRLAVTEEIFERLGMRDSVPGRDLADTGNRARAMFTGSQLDRFGAALQRLATPYRVDRGGKASRSEYRPQDVNAATGMVSTAQDLARFDAALDDGDLLHSDLLAVAWSNVTTSSGAPLPSGLGWFVQTLQRRAPGLALRRHLGRGVVAAHQGAGAGPDAHPARQRATPSARRQSPRAMSRPRSSPSSSCASSLREALAAPRPVRVLLAAAVAAVLATPALGPRRHLRLAISRPEVQGRDQRARFRRRRRRRQAVHRRVGTVLVSDKGPGIEAEIGYNPRFFERGHRRPGVPRAA